MYLKRYQDNMDIGHIFGQRLVPGNMPYVDECCNEVIENTPTKLRFFFEKSAKLPKFDHLSSGN